MAVDFMKSETKDNLMCAFAGESQARNRYTMAAEEMEQLRLYSIRDIFLYTADQERAHAERFYELLKPAENETIHIDGGYPVDVISDAVSALRAAEHNEREEFEDVYPHFGDVAKAEGFLEVASSFYQIAEIEHIHQVRFGKLADLYKENMYFESKTEGKWICTNCGYIHEGKRAPEVCPVCRHEKGYFLPLAFAPYLGMLSC